MRANFLEFDDYGKLKFLISGLQCNFTIEWVTIYKKILIWVNEMYTERKKIYDDTEK